MNTSTSNKGRYSTPTVTVIGSLADLTKGASRMSGDWSKKG